MSIPDPRKSRAGRKPLPNPQVMVGCRVPPHIAAEIKRRGGLKPLLLAWYKRGAPRGRNRQ